MANKMFSAAAKAGKRIPKWAWYVSGGVLVAGGIYAVKQRQAVNEPSGDLATDEGAVGYTDASQAPGIIVPAQIGGEAVPAEINTDIPSATLDLIGGVVTDLVGVIQGQPSADDMLQIIAAAGSPQAGGDSSGVVAAAPVSAPAPAPAPKPSPCSQLEAGYNCGATVDMGANAKKTFSGAVGWARIASGGTGADHWIDVHVRFCGRLERWRVLPNQNNRWSKVWAGDRPNIC